MTNLHDARVEAAAHEMYEIDDSQVTRAWNELPGEMQDGYIRMASSILAAADAVVTVDMITVPRPRVPFGPDGVPEDEATANYLREVVKKIDGGYTNVGGSNVTATVRKLLVDVADSLLRGGDGGE